MLIGPIPIEKWQTLKRLSESLKSDKTSDTRRKREKFQFDFILDKFKEAA